MNFGQWLKQLREDKGLTRKELALFGGIAASTLGQIEVGSIKRPPNKRLEGFAFALNIPFERMLEALGEK